MDYRFHNVAKHDEEDSESESTFIGGTADVDLWMCKILRGEVRRDDCYVLICQYDDEHKDVSYYPPSTVLDHAKGSVDHLQGTKWGGGCVTSLPPTARVYWDSMNPDHNATLVAKYLATFYPDIFTEDERNEALGLPLTTMEK